MITCVSGCGRPAAAQKAAPKASTTVTEISLHTTACVIAGIGQTFFSALDSQAAAVAYQDPTTSLYDAFTPLLRLLLPAHAIGWSVETGLTMLCPIQCSCVAPVAVRT